MSAGFLDRCWQNAYRVAYRLAKCYWFVFRPSSKGAYVAVWVDDKVLIALNSYKSDYAMPAGGLHRGESFSAAAVRELREEVGIQAQESDLTLIAEYENRDEFKNDVAQLFELRLSTTPEVTIDHREVVSAEFLTLEEALALPLVPALRSYLSSRQAEPAGDRVSGQMHE